MSGLQAVLFDMDGLLVDTEHTWFVAERTVMAELGADWDEADQAHTVGGPMERATRYMAEKAGSDLPWQAVAGRLIDAMADLLVHGADHRPGAQALLDDLVAAGVPCALVSSSPRRLVDAVLASVGGDHFTTTIAGDEVPRTKPNPDPYLQAARHLGVQPSRCVVLEDSPVGIAAAEAAGCVVVAVPFVVPIEPGPRRHVVGSLTELDAVRLRTLVAGD
ncbi:MAG TPA: HAD family phosphatase [Actinomycetes bacterium]